MGWQCLAGVSAGAISGASAGSKAGPYGAAAGAIIGGVAVLGNLPSCQDNGPTPAPNPQAGSSPGGMSYSDYLSEEAQA